MRTPAQTLERLAEVAPKGWSLDWDDDEGALGVRELFCSYRPCPSDIENSYLTAWCKKQLRERGQWGHGLSVSWFKKDECAVEVWRRPDVENVCTAVCPTEWQAVAECLIAVLEKEND